VDPHPARRRRRARAVRAALGWLLAIGCTAPPRAPTPGNVASPDLAASLVALGEGAFAEGDAETARGRFARASLADPGSAAARAGLGRALARLGRAEESRRALGEALALDPRSATAHLGLAELDGPGDAGRAELERALALDPGNLEAHTRLAAWTGPAPPGAPADPEQAAARVRAHPYDPRALVEAGEWLLREDDVASAQAALERAVQLADLDPAAAERAAALLQQRVPAWSARRVVWVHAFADELLTRDPTWRFQLRCAWSALSESLDPLLATRFAPIALGSFRSEGAGLDLDAVAGALRRQQPSLPESGLVAVFTGRPLPKAPGTWRRGEAEYLGRFLTVRLAPGEVTSFVLAHEVIHLYGGIHVNPEVASLMNPSAERGALDPWNAAIVRALRDRRFGPGGLEENVLRHIDLSATIAAYRAALQANVALRNEGVLQALDAGGGSPLAVTRQLRAATVLDDHLGDVATFVAELLVRDGRLDAGVRMLEGAARLYGPGTAHGRRALDRARSLGQHIPPAMQGGG